MEENIKNDELFLREYIENLKESNETRVKTHEITSSDLYQLYCCYCEKNNAGKPISKNKCGRKLSGNINVSRVRKTCKNKRYRFYSIDLL